MKFCLFNFALTLSLVACTVGDPTDWVNVEYTLGQVKGKFSGGSSTADAQTYIFHEAEASALKGPWSIVSPGGSLPPSGDAHDFLSWAPYHWPNCDWCSSSSRSYVVNVAFSPNSTESSIESSRLQSNAAYDYDHKIQSVLDLTVSTQASEALSTVTLSSRRGLDVSTQEATIHLPTSLPISSIAVVNPATTSTASVSGRQPPGPAQAAAKTTKASCSPSPSKSLQPSATWTTCPYVARDGAVNPDVRTLKGPEAINSAAQSVIYNAVAYALQKSPPYSKSAADTLEAFFLAPSTKMNSNVRFGQIVRGPGEGGQTGTFTGILDLRGLVKIINGIFLLRAAGSPHWNSTLNSGMTLWASDYSTWLATSDIGKMTASRPNNHGTFYVSQLAATKYLLGDRTGAIATLQKFCTTTFQDQIAKSGEQPFEAVRTRPYHYRCFNIEALITNAKLGDELGIDMWSCKSRYGGTIQTAVNFLMSTNPGDEDATQLFPHIAAVAAAYGDPKGEYIAYLKKNAVAYESKPWWFNNQAAAFPNAPTTRKNVIAKVWKREDPLTLRDDGLGSTPVNVEFRCPNVFRDVMRVEIENGMYTTCDELRPFYEEGA